MVKTERAEEVTGAAIRSNAAAEVASRGDRMSRYATVAKMAASIPTAVIVATADGATTYSGTGLTEVVSHTDTAGSIRSLAITGAGGVKVADLKFGRIANPTNGFSGADVYIEAVGGGRADVRNVAIFDAVNGSVNRWAYMPVPVAAGATWSNTGRTAGQFRARNAYGGGPSVILGYTSDAGVVGFGWSDRGAGEPAVGDPLNLGNTGKEWFALFRFTGGSVGGNYGWISYTANVVGVGNASITITGWGWDDSGQPIAAGFTGTAVPGGAGLAALACGAIGLRGRRRSRH